MFELRTISSLKKVFPGRQIQLEAPELVSDVAARGETYAFQIAIRTETPTRMRVNATGDLNVRIRLVEAVPVHNPGNGLDSDVVGRGEPGLYPDLLSPLQAGERFMCQAGFWHTLWVDVVVGADAAAGRHQLSFAFTPYTFGADPAPLPEQAQKIAFNLDVADFTLPPQTFRRFEWFHCDCISDYYGVEAWSERHWELVENFARNAFSHGINMLYTPLWTPPLDTEVGGERPNCQLLGIEFSSATGKYTFDFSRLKRYIAMGHRIGFEYFSMSHMVTQWGAKATPKIYVNVDGCVQKRFGWHVASTAPEYREFLNQLMPQLLAVLRAEGLTGKCYFSISDEPREENMESYTQVVEMIRPLLEGFPTIEALSHPIFAERGLVPMPVPVISHLTEFLDIMKSRWTYYCCSPVNTYPNRFIAMPSRRARIFGILAYIYQLQGFLHWGFNFYFSQYSRQLIDPFFRNDSDSAYFPGGDPFIVYPGQDGDAWDSLRGENFFHGMQDLRALQELEKRIGRDATLALLNEGLEQPLSLIDYPRNDEWLIAVRRRIYERIG